ncbi:Plasmodium exported protein (Pm-fam-a like), unknown function [Plasmodium malariae]|uniref:Fam-l protein n=1 Tax=Plasmodium malariae TaxID=5858 RepID=A0A1A8X169_PLAMA|nr:Plasmodium exported protein (Pm-fam-a like), unknown function [Plasmodium malariae]
MLSNWICQFYNEMSCLNNSLDEKCNFCRKFNTRNYRLLVKYKQNKYSNIAKFKKEVPDNEVKQNKCLSNNKKGLNGKYNPLCRSTLYIEEYGQNLEKNKCDIPKTKKYPDFEKKIFKELSYKDYLKNVKITDDKEYKKLARKKRRTRIALILLFILILILPILDLSLENLVDGGLLGLLHLLYPNLGEKNVLSGVDGQLVTLLSNGKWGNLDKICASTIFIYGVPFLIFVVIFIFGMVYYYKKVIKYENVKFTKRINKK